MRHMLKKHKYYLLLSMIVFSTIINVFSVTRPVAAAADPAQLYLDSRVSADAKASAYRVSLALCLTNGDFMSGFNSGDYDTMSSGQAASGEWFNNANSESSRVRPGIIVWSKAHDYIDCSTLVKNHGDVVSALGFKNNIELACGAGLVRKDGKNCLNDPDQSDFTREKIGHDKNKVYAALDKHRKNASAPPSNGYNDAQYYLIAAKTYIDFCKAKPIANVNGQKVKDDQTIAAKYKDHKATVVDSTGTKTEVYFDVPDSGKEAFLRNKEENFNWVEESCGKMEDRMNEYAGSYAAFIKAHPPSPEDAASGTVNDDNEINEKDENKTSCKVEGIGWIICPVMRFMAKVVDAAYDMVANLLTVKPLSTSTSGDLYKAWSFMRDFANVAFVIAFLIIIYSQITGTGVSNYGVKKMLPRLIVAAILVNVSYWICAVAVDLSNILGTSLKGLLDGISASLFVGGSGAEAGNPGTLWDGLTVGLLAGTAAGIALYLGLSALFPMLIMALFAIITVVLILTLRQALIIILIFLSPLAFVAYLLPNTESLYKKWKDLFQLLLLMFPIIALLFGGCQLASTVIGNGNPGFILQVVAAGVTVVPLFVTPFIIKTTSGVLNRWAGTINNPNKGPFDRMRKKAEGYREYRQNRRGANALSGTGKVFGGGQFKRSYRRDLRNSSASDSLKSAQAQFGVTDSKAAGYVQSSAISNAQTSAINNANNTRLTNSLANNANMVSAGMGAAADDAVVQNALAAQQRRAFAEAIKDAQISANIAPGDVAAIGAALERAVKNNDSIGAQAMQNMLLTSGGPGIKEYRNTMNRLEGTQTADGVNSMDSEAMTEMRRNLLQNHGGIKASAADLTAQASKGGNLSEISNNADTWKLSDAELVNQKGSSVEFAINSGAISPEQAKRISDDPELVKHLEPSVRQSMKALGDTTPPAPTPTPSPSPTPPPPGPTPPPPPPPGP